MESKKTMGWKHKSTNKLSEKQQAKIGKVMHEFKEGELHSGSKKGPVVTDRDQAIAIALSEANASKKMVKGGYTVPAYDVKTTGVYLFKTKNDSFYLLSYLFERENDTEDSIEIQDDLRDKLGSILIQNSSWKRLASGKPVKARSNDGGYIGTLTRVDDTRNVKKYISGTYNDYEFNDGGGVSNNIYKGLEQFKKDEIEAGNDANIYLANFNGSDIDAYYTNKTFKDGVPVTKYFYDNKSKNINPKGKYYILESDSWWYFKIDNTWYAVEKSEYGTPPFEYGNGGSIDDIEPLGYKRKDAVEYGKKLLDNGAKYIQVRNKIEEQYAGLRGEIQDVMNDILDYKESKMVKGGGLNPVNVQNGDIFRNTLTDELVKIEVVGTDSNEKQYILKSYPNSSKESEETLLPYEFNRFYTNGLYEKIESDKMSNGGGVETTPEIEAKKLSDKLKVIVVADGFQGSNKEIIKLRVYPNSKPGDRFYDNRSAQAFSLNYSKGKYQFLTAGGYNKIIQDIAKLLMLPIRSNTGYAGRSSVDTSLRPINISQSNIKKIVKIMQDGLRDESKSESDYYKKMSEGGELDKMSLAQLLDKVPIFEQMHIEGYSEFIKQKMVYDDFNNKTGNKHLSFEEKRFYDEISKRKLKALLKYKENIIEWIKKHKKAGKMSEGGELTKDDYKQMILKYDEEVKKMTEAYIKFSESGDVEKANKAKYLGNIAAQNSYKAKEMWRDSQNKMAEGGGFENVKQYKNYQEFVKDNIGSKKYPLDIKSVSQPLSGATEESIQEQFKLLIFKNFLDSEFQYNYASSEHIKDEYMSFVNRYYNLLINSPKEFTLFWEKMKKSNDYDTLYEIVNDRYFLDIFNKYKNEMSNQLKQEYISYRKKYAGEDLNFKYGGKINIGDTWEWHGIEYDQKKGDNYKVVKQVLITNVDSKGQVKGRFVGTANDFIVREPGKYLKKKVSSLNKMTEGGGFGDIENEDEILDFYYGVKQEYVNNGSNSQEASKKSKFDTIGKFSKSNIKIEYAIKNLIDESENKYNNGGEVSNKVKYSVEFKKRKSLGNYDRELEISESNKTLNQIYNLLYNIEYKDNGWQIKGNILIKDDNGVQIRIPEFTSNLDLQKMFDEKRNLSSKMSEGGGWVEKPVKIKKDVYKFEDHQGVGYIVKRDFNERLTPMWIVSTDEEGTASGNPTFYTKKSAEKYIESFFQDGGQLNALIEDIKEFEKNIYPKNSDISYKNRLIIAHFKTKGYSIIEISKALKTIRKA
jgi:hypothetical protein